MYMLMVQVPLTLNGLSQPLRRGHFQPKLSIGETVSFLWTKIIIYQILFLLEPFSLPFL